MDNLRIYGTAPYTVALLHGGPGAPGQMAPVARVLSRDYGVLEPLQTAGSVDGQVAELYEVLDKHGDCPVTLIGSSWGAFLGFICAARHPETVRKLILVGSAPFDISCAASIHDTRMSRLTPDERREIDALTDVFADPDATGKDAMLARFGELFTKADAFDPLTLDTETIGVRFDIFERVWSEASGLRRSGELLRLGELIRCPVVAVHGDYDPHPAEGVRAPLASVLDDFRFVLLDRCGHIPWIERTARDEFYRVVREEIG